MEDVLKQYKSPEFKKDANKNYVEDEEISVLINSIEVKLERLKQILMKE